jgi:hypothetical protein
MKSLKYILIFILSTLLTVACGGGGGSSVSSLPTNAQSAADLVQQSVAALSAAFAPVAF